MDEPKYTKQTKTAEELQAMILEDLRKVDGWSQQGVNITVYDMPWNAMMMSDDDVWRCRRSSPKAELQGVFEIITERLGGCTTLSRPAAALPAAEIASENLPTSAGKSDHCPTLAANDQGRGSCKSKPVRSRFN
jgi:hypothetical protein